MLSWPPAPGCVADGLAVGVLPLVPAVGLVAAPLAQPASATSSIRRQRHLHTLAPFELSTELFPRSVELYYMQPVERADYRGQPALLSKQAGAGITAGPQSRAKATTETPPLTMFEVLCQLQ